MQSLYLLRTGCQVATVAARISTVWHGLSLLSSLAKLRCVVHLHRVHYEQARHHAGRAACPSVVIMDGQSSRRPSVVALVVSTRTSG